MRKYSVVLAYVFFSTAVAFADGMRKKCISFGWEHEFVTPAQLLANGEVKVDRLYSTKKDKYFSAKLVMEIIDDKPEYSLEFPKREKKGKKKMKSRWE